jgi:hypothetical protein
MSYKKVFQIIFNLSLRLKIKVTLIIFIKVIFIWENLIMM